MPSENRERSQRPAAEPHAQRQRARRWGAVGGTLSVVAASMFGIAATHGTPVANTESQSQAGSLQPSAISDDTDSGTAVDDWSYDGDTTSEDSWSDSGPASNDGSGSQSSSNIGGAGGSGSAPVPSAGATGQS